MTDDEGSYETDEDNGDKGDGLVAGLSSHRVRAQSMRERRSRAHVRCLGDTIDEVCSLFCLFIRCIYVDVIVTILFYSLCFLFRMLSIDCELRCACSPMVYNHRAPTQLPPLLLLLLLPPPPPPPPLQHTHYRRIV